MAKRMATTDTRPRGALAALDLLRFAAAMLVLVHHFFGRWRVRLEYGLGPTAPNETIPTGAWLHSGWVGVEIFFVISGYVIARSATGASAGEFAWRRFLRLWPGALVCATITAAVLLVGGVTPAEVLPRWLQSATLFPGGNQIDGVYWTLGVECAFYALVALLLWRGWWRPVRVGLALGAWSFAYWVFALANGGLADLAFTDRLADLALGRWGAFFALGILIEAAHRQDPAFRPVQLLPAMLVAPLCIAWHAAMQRVGAAAAGAELAPHVLFAAGLAIIACAPRLQSLFSDRMAHLAVSLGLATYPLYLLHQYVGQSLLLWLARHGVAPMLAVGPVAATMIALSLWVALRVEPWLRQGLRTLRRIPGPAEARAA